MKITARDMTWHDCIECGVIFAMTKDFIRQRIKDGRGFFCPNGHKQYVKYPTG